jgi:hypothetical protein
MTWPTALVEALRVLAQPGALVEHPIALLVGLLLVVQLLAGLLLLVVRARRCRR